MKLPIEVKAGNLIKLSNISVISEVDATNVVGISHAALIDELSEVIPTEPQDARATSRSKWKSTKSVAKNLCQNFKLRLVP